jgi:hypothetical protein
MTETVDPERRAAAQETLAAWSNARALDPSMRLDASYFDQWEVTSYDEFLVFTSAGGYTNQSYLVQDGLVKPFALTTHTLESAAGEARAERDGTEPPERPGPAITWGD